MSYYRTAADRKAEAARARQITEESSKGSNMWYTVLHSTAFDQDGYKAGTIYNCVYRPNIKKVAMYKINQKDDTLEQTASFVISREVARQYFSAPTESFLDAMEQSFMVSEAAYC